MTSSSGAVDLPSPSSRAARKRPLSPPPQHVQLPVGNSNDGAASSSASEASSSTAWDKSQPQRLLHVFAGPGGRADGLRQMMWDMYGIIVVEYDTLIDSERCDITRDDVFDELLARIAAGEFFAAIIGTPCSTFSVARIRKHGEDQHGPEQLRSEAHVEGLPGLPDFLQQKVDVSNLLVERSVQLARAIKAVGGQFVIENPVTRSDPRSEHYRWVWRSHGSLWMHPAVSELLGERWTRVVDFPQCALGGAFQKFTTLAYSVDLEPGLRPLAALRCTHDRHVRQAVGLDSEGKWHSATAAAYPADMNALLATACVRAMRKHGLHVGSAKPHEHARAADAARPASRPAPTSSSLRRLEAEVEAVLVTEALPRVNVPPETAWVDAPPPPADLPRPKKTDDLIPVSMQRRLRAFRTQVGSCFEAASRGRWRWARDHRPEPLHAPEHECLHAGARGWTWAYCARTDLWYPITPSRWPDDPPPGEIDAAAAISYAERHSFTDMGIIAYMAHGFPGPSLPKEAVLGPPHVGALKEPAAFGRMAAKDRKNGWVRFGYALPPVWPMRADPMNIVFRHDKPRMTIDKTMRLVAGVPSYNDAVDLGSQPSIEYVSVSQLGRAAAIFRAAGLNVKVWGFDLEAYFRKTGKQQADVWMSGFCHQDGFGVDERVQFGQREAPVLTGRQSCFIVWAIRRELRRLDLEYPSDDRVVAAWLAARAQLRAADLDQGEEWVWDVLYFVLMFVDDVGGVSVDDDLRDGKGAPWMVERDGISVRHTRAWLHYEAAIGVIRMFGHVDADGKGVTPFLDMVYLGVTIDVGTGFLSLSKEKCDEYGAAVLKLLKGRNGNGGIVAPAAELSSVMHKLLHASSVIPLGRQHLFHVMRAGRATSRLAGGAKLLGDDAQSELAWWCAMLARDAAQRGVPLAFRSAFPDPRDPGVIVPYSDASREIDAIDESGYGAWAIIGGVLVYVEGRWTTDEVLLLDINVLELLAMNLGTFTFIEYAQSADVEVTHVFEFTDNTSAEHSTERGKPRASGLGALVHQRYDALYSMGIFSSAERIASVDNDVADGLSRGGAKLADALRIATGAGYRVQRLDPSAEWRDTSQLIAAAQAATLRPDGRRASRSAAVRWNLN